ncbi:MAG: ABC transporter permease [Longimicrobiales bacterium]
MIQDIGTVAWKEWRELLRLGGGRRGLLLRALFSVGLLGVLWPWLIGASFVDSGLPILFAATTAAMYVSALVPDAFPGERERHTLETLLASRLPDSAILLGKIGALVSYALGAALLMLLTGWITVNLKIGADGLLFYRPNVLVTAIAFAALTAGLVAAFGTVVSLRAATVKQAQQVLTTAIMLVLLAPAILAEAWPRVWQRLVDAVSAAQPAGARKLIFWAAAMIALQLLLLGIARRRFVRSRLLAEIR